MSARMLSTRLLGPVAAVGLIAAVSLPAGDALAASTAAAVTCPTVNPTTGQVTPGWANGVDWAGCDLAGANLEYAELANADLSGANFTGADFQNADVAYSDLTGANLTGAKLEATNLSGTSLAGATLTNASSGGVTGPVASLPSDWSLIGGFLVGPAANLTYANLLGDDLTGVDLSGANLTNANVKQATLSGLNLTGATLTGIESGNVIGTPTSLPANWSLIDGYLIGPGANLNSADLIGADLAGLDLDGAALANTDLRLAYLTDTNLTGTTLTGANLGGADLTGATLTGAQPSGINGTPAALPANWTLQSGYLLGPGVDLPGANLYQFDLSSLDLAGANLSTADLLDANLTGVDLEKASLSSAQFNRATMVSTNLSGADLSDAILESNNLTDANLTGANLTGAALQQANLAGINLAGATLTGIAASADSGTPAALPADWTYQGGYLIGPGASLTDATLTGFRLTGADLAGASMTGVSAEHVNLTNANLAGADVESGDLSFANLSGAKLTDANLSYTNLSYANFTNASLDGAAYTGGTFAGVLWDNTTCPDGSNSNDHVSGCFSALGTPVPEAAPVVSGTVGRNGWYTSTVTITWNWSDPAGALNTADCTKSSTSSGEGKQTLTASCADTAGNVGTASYLVQVDSTRPQVTVTGVKPGARYAVGAVPVAGCSTSESVSGVSRAAALQPASGTGGLGEHTVRCAGALSTAGLTQAKPVYVSYSVLYGFAGFQAPKAGSTIAKSAHHITVLFRLVSATGATLSGTTAARLGSSGEVRVTLTGPGIRAVDATCRWVSASDRFRCSVAIPAKAKTGKSRKYSLTAEENLGWGFVRAPGAGGAASQETVHFK